MSSSRKFSRGSQMKAGSAKSKKKKPMSKRALAAKRSATKKGRKASGKKNASVMKRKGVGLFKPKRLSTEMKNFLPGSQTTMSRPAVTREIWKYIKSKGLNNGRTITPDDKLGKITGNRSFDMLQLGGKLSNHLS